MPNDLRCVHVPNGRTEDSFLLPHGSMLILCPLCFDKVRLAVLESIIIDSLKQVFEATAKEAVNK